MQRTELEERMARRVRLHMLTSFGGIVLAIVVALAAGGLARLLFGPAQPAWVAVASLLGMLLIPAIGFTSTLRNLRCPSCERVVALQVSWNYSLFGSWAKKTCNHCGQKIFADDVGPRFRRFLFIAMAVGMAFGILSVILTATLGH
jgi:hypothetical protein